MTKNSKVYNVLSPRLIMPEIEIKVKGYKCNNCANEWIPRSQKERPLICPKCKSSRWDKPKKKKI
jgi:DNA-directed RNA polymerase subunit RPC12/RpoP